MPKVIFKDKEFDCNNDKSVLENILAQGSFMPYSCQNGFCHACLSKAVKGKVPQASQEGLKDSLKAQDCFLPCLCHPSENLEIELATKDNVTFEVEGISTFKNYTTMVIDKSWLSDDILRLCLVRPEELRYKAGQFINLIQPETQVTRSYSLASTPCENFMELHIKRVPNGLLSNWLCDHLTLGENIEISGPAGECYYQEADSKQDLILAGVGTGLAPLYGILREALEAEHQGNIYLFHASLDQSGLYFQEEIAILVEESSNLTYIPCVLKGEVPQGGKQGAIDQLIIETLGDCAGKRAYLCGDDAVVETLENTLLKAGVKRDDILADAFVAAK